MPPKRDALYDALGGPAPVQSYPGLDQAYQGSAPAAATGRPYPFQLNQNLENQAVSQGNNPMNPMIASIARRFGLMSMLRNRANSQYVDPESTPPNANY